MNSKELNELKAKIIELMAEALDQVQSFDLDEWAAIRIDEAIGTLNQLLDLTEKYLEEVDEAE